MRIGGIVFISLALWSSCISSKRSDSSKQHLNFNVLIGEYYAGRPSLWKVGGGYLFRGERYYYGERLTLYEDSTFTSNTCRLVNQKWRIEGDSLFLTAEYSDTLIARAKELKGIDLNGKKYWSVYRVINKEPIQLVSCSQMTFDSSTKSKRYCVTLNKVED